MRQLKAFMKAKKWVCSKKCECLTINMWRCADLQNDYEFCGCDETKTADMGKAILSWFKNSPVYKSLTDGQKEQALADAQEIIEWAWDGIAPFYQAMKKGKTFAGYAREMWLDVDESGACDSTIYEDEEAFIIYISAAGTIDCKYLALVARRGRTPTRELINKEAISDYLDWVTTSSVTYQFKDWDDEILKVGTVEKGQTPVAPTDLPERPGYRFTWWSPEVWPITQDTTFVAQYVIPVASVSNIPDHIQAIKLWESSTYTFNYAPANANDFSNLNLVEVCNCYDEPIITASVVYDNGVATVTASYPEEQQDTSWGVEVWLDGEKVGTTNISWWTYPIEQISNVPESFRVNVGETTTLTFNYLPVNANDFTNLEIEDWEDTYWDEHTSSTVSYNDWVVTITTTGTLEWLWGISYHFDESWNTIEGRVIPEWMGYVVSVATSGDWYGTVSINDWQETYRNTVAYSPAPAWEFILDWDVLEINSYGSYAESLSTYLHPHAEAGYEFVWWFYDPSGSYDERARVHNGDMIDEDVTIYACFERAQSYS